MTHLSPDGFLLPIRQSALPRLYTRLLITWNLLLVRHRGVEINIVESAAFS